MKIQSFYQTTAFLKATIQFKRILLMSYPNNKRTCQFYRNPWWILTGETRWLWNSLLGKDVPSTDSKVKSSKDSLKKRTHNKNNDQIKIHCWKPPRKAFLKATIQFKRVLLNAHVSSVLNSINKNKTYLLMILSVVWNVNAPKKLKQDYSYLPNNCVGPNYIINV